MKTQPASMPVTPFPKHKRRFLKPEIQSATMPFRPTFRQKPSSRKCHSSKNTVWTWLTSFLCCHLSGCADDQAKPSQLDWQLTPLAAVPQWEQLESYQHTITQEDFLSALTERYQANATSSGKFIQVSDTHAQVIKSFKRPAQLFELQFAADQSSKTRPPRYWKSVDDLPTLQDPAKPLADVHIALDPGHLGGSWAEMERRWFLVPHQPTKEEDALHGPWFPVMEGSIVLEIAQLLTTKLEALGARVSLVRTKLEPVTTQRPEDFVAEARALLGLSPQVKWEHHKKLQITAESLFYRSAEIRARAELVNRKIQPDLALSIHLNAEPWGDPASPQLTDINHFHLLINGCYSRSEISKDDQRWEMLLRLLQRTHEEESKVADVLAEVMAAKTGLPPYVYPGPNAKRVSANPFVFARNLLATRVYLCPTLLLEPYVMNSTEAHARIQAGRYPGKRTFQGKPRYNLYEEYAQAVAEGLRSYYLQARTDSP